MARLVAITELKNVPPDIRPFVDFKAAIEERELQENEPVAILVIETTTCYVPVFLKEPPTMAALEKELERQGAKLTPDSKAALEDRMKV